MSRTGPAGGPNCANPTSISRDDRGWTA